MPVWMASCDKTKSFCTYARCPLYYGKDNGFDNYRVTCPHKKPLKENTTP